MGGNSLQNRHISPTIPEIESPQMTVKKGRMETLPNREIKISSNLGLRSLGEKNLQAIKRRIPRKIRI